MQSDGQEAVERSLSGDDQQQSGRNGVTKHLDVSLPPRFAVAQERMCVQMTNEGRSEQTNVVGEVQSATKEQLPVEKGPAKSGKIKMAKKAAACEDRRRKRKIKAPVSDSSGISQASARMLFRCSCQLLRNQTLEYDVRAREMEERNAAQMREIDEWEKRIRSLKRELEEYADEQLDEATDLALAETTHSTTARAVEEQTKALPSTTTVFGTIETSLPPAVIAAEAKLQDELRKRTEKVKEFCRNLPGFIQSRDEPASRYF